MKQNALYFPYINVPNNSWFLRILLYWDKVSSIVPYDYINNPDRLDPFMRELVVAELVEQISPASYYYKVPKFEEIFLTYIEKQIARKSKRINYLRPNPRYSSIHIEKIGNIGHELVKMGIAIEKEYPWYEVENWAANAFMSYLALCLGNIPAINASPVTNSITNFGINIGLQLPATQTNHKLRNEISRSLIKFLLPEPSVMPSIDEIVNFKSTNKERLIQLRACIENYSIEIANIRNEVDRVEKISLVTQEINGKVQIINEAMKSKWRNVILKTLLPITGAIFSLVVSVQNPIALVPAGISVITAVNEAYTDMRNYDHILNQPLAYVALARRNIFK